MKKVGLLILSLCFISCNSNFRMVVNSTNEGPFVTYKAGSVVITSCDSAQVFDSVTISKRLLSKVDFNCCFDKLSCPDLKFNIKPYKTAVSEVDNLPLRVIAISDIEGNFEKYYQFLVANKVMDGNYNWIFGNGHLVVLGDLVDRGDFATQCLWLTYHLEQQANSSGGQVHYILGNHEQLNMLGYNNYCSPKLKQTLTKLNIKIDNLFSTSTELGQWMRTRSAVLKIGEVLFVHAGISPAVLAYDLNLPTMNAEIRRDIDKDVYRTDASMTLLTEEGLLWYRGLVEAQSTYDKIQPNDLEKILANYKVRSIVVGHTPVDSVSTDFEGKIVRIDVNHSKNCSGLLLEANVFYSIDIFGNKIKL